MYMDMNMKMSIRMRGGGQKIENTEVIQYFVIDQELRGKMTTCEFLEFPRFQNCQDHPLTPSGSPTPPVKKNENVGLSSLWR